MKPRNQNNKQTSYHGMANRVSYSGIVLAGGILLYTRHAFKHKVNIEVMSIYCTISQ